MSLVPSPAGGARLVLPGVGPGPLCPYFTAASAAARCTGSRPRTWRSVYGQRRWRHARARKGLGRRRTRKGDRCESASCRGARRHQSDSATVRRQHRRNVGAVTAAAQTSTFITTYTENAFRGREHASVWCASLVRGLQGVECLKQNHNHNPTTYLPIVVCHRARCCPICRKPFGLASNVRQHLLRHFKRVKNYIRALDLEWRPLPRGLGHHQRCSSRSWGPVILQVFVSRWNPC